MLLFDAFELWLIVEEVVVGAVKPVHVLVKKMLCSCHLKEELRTVGEGSGDGGYLWGRKKGNEGLHEIEVATVDQAA